MKFKEHLKNYLSEEQINSLLASLEGKSKHAALLNLRKMDDNTFISYFPNVIKHPIVPHAYLYDKDEYELGKSVFFDLGCFYLQEPSALTVAYLLNPNENDTVLDLCAAPGGKTIGCSFLMNNKGLIISNDSNRERANTIIQNIEDLGIANVIVTNNDFSRCYQKFLNSFDKIVLDAPCSGSGMFRKDIDVKNDWSYNKVLKYSEIQKELITYTYQMLKPGGKMVYSTCSFSFEEDEEVINHLLINTNAEIIEIPDNPLFFKSSSKLGIHLLTNQFPGEGHYICLISKPGLDIYNSKAIEPKQISMLKEYSLSIGLIYKQFGDFIFGITKDFDTKSLNVLRKGVKVGEYKNKILKYDNHYSRFLTNFENELEITESDFSSYIKGDVIRKESYKGWVLLKYQSIPFSLAKSDGNIIKNHYPKYLRKKF